jgi:hypothetical protein
MVPQTGNRVRASSSAAVEQKGGLESTPITLASLKESLLYSEELGINLETLADSELFKWFLASLLLGARISGAIAEKTYRAFEKHNLLTPRTILDAGWDFLVNPVMREGDMYATTRKHPERY